MTWHGNNDSAHVVCLRLLPPQHEFWFEIAPPSELEKRSIDNHLAALSSSDHLVNRENLVTSASDR